MTHAVNIHICEIKSVSDINKFGSMSDFDRYGSRFGFTSRGLSDRR